MNDFPSRPQQQWEKRQQKDDATYVVSFMLNQQAKYF